MLKKRIQKPVLLPSILGLVLHGSNNKNEYHNRKL